MQDNTFGGYEYQSIHVKRSMGYIDQWMPEESPD